MSEVKDIKAIIPEMSQKEIVERYCTQFNNSTKKLEELTVSEECEKAGWNIHLPIPLSGKAFKHPDQTEVKEGYTRVVYSKYNIIAIFANNRFEEFKTLVEG